MHTRIQGIPCQVSVTSYIEARPMQVTGSGFGDAIAPDLEEVEFDVLDRKGYLAHWLERKMTSADRARIIGELKDEH